MKGDFNTGMVHIFLYNEDNFPTIKNELKKKGCVVTFNQLQLHLMLWNMQVSQSFIHLMASPFFSGINKQLIKKKISLSCNRDTKKSVLRSFFNDGKLKLLTLSMNIKGPLCRLDIVIIRYSITK